MKRSALLLLLANLLIIGTLHAQPSMDELKALQAAMRKVYDLVHQEDQQESSSSASSSTSSEHPARMAFHYAIEALDRLMDTILRNREDPTIAADEDFWSSVIKLGEAMDILDAALNTPQEEQNNNSDLNETPSQVYQELAQDARGSTSSDFAFVRQEIAEILIEFNHNSILSDNQLGNASILTEHKLNRMQDLIVGYNILMSRLFANINTEEDPLDASENNPHLLNINATDPLAQSLSALTFFTHGSHHADF